MNELLKNRLKDEFGLTDEQVAKLEAEGVVAESDLELLTAKDIQDVTGSKLIPARKIHEAFKARPTVAPVPPPIDPAAPIATAADPNAEVPDGARPSKAQVDNFASSLGVPADMMNMFLFSSMMGNAGMDFDVASMFPIPQIVAGYRPNMRNMYMQFMTQLERMYGTPIVVINEDGSVNRELTVKYVESLENGDSPMEDDIYFDESNNAFQIIAVGVDAQGVRDADPLVPTKPLPTTSVGTGRVNWNGVGLEARQVVFYAATQTNELNPNDEAHTAWLRDHVKAGISRLIFSRQYPLATKMFNNNARMGSLPTLKVMPTRGPRRRETMARRRVAQPRDLSGLGQSGGGPFRREDRDI